MIYELSDNRRLLTTVTIRFRSREPPAHKVQITCALR